MPEINYRLTLVNNLRKLYLYAYGQAGDEYLLMYPDNTKEFIAMDKVESIAATAVRQPAYDLYRNQGMRRATVLLQTKAFDLAYYFMPNGSIFLSKIECIRLEEYTSWKDNKTILTREVDDYDPITFAKSLKYITTNEQKKRFLEMLISNNEYLNDQTNTRRNKWGMRPDYSRKVEQNNQRIKTIVSLPLPEKIK